MYRLLFPLLWIRDVYRGLRHVRRMRRIEREKRLLGLTSHEPALGSMGANNNLSRQRFGPEPELEQSPPYSARDIARDCYAQVDDWVVIDLPLEMACISPMFCGPLYNPLHKVVEVDEHQIEVQISARSRARLKHGQYGVYKPGRDNYSTSYGFIPLERAEAKMNA